MFLLLVFIGLLVSFNHANAATKHPNEFKPTTAEVVAKLGWTPDDTTVCSGYYQDPLAAFSGIELADINSAPIEIDAGPITIQKSGVSTLSGNVVVKQPGRLLRANKVELYRDAKTGKITTADLQGNVVLREPNRVVMGKKAHVDLTDRAGSLQDVLYRFLMSGANPASNINTKIPLNAWGKADYIEQEKSGAVELQNTTYSTCAPTANTWQISAKKINLDREDGRGVVRDGWIYFGGTPVVYVPYLSFPIDNRRKSGFLFPTISNSVISGFSFAVPYYWNIASNYDFLFTPRLLTKRGVQLNGLFRYLTDSSSGSINAGFLPNDYAFSQFKRSAASSYATSPSLNQLLNSSNNRSLFSWKDMRTLGSRWTSLINYNYVGDDYYLQNFGGLNLLAQNQLPQMATINYAGDNWNFVAKTAGYKTLHLVNQSGTSNIYRSLPEMDFNGSYPNQAFGLNYQLNNQAVYFLRSQNPGETINPPTATRLNMQPVINWPLTWTAGYIKPTLQFFATHYNIGSQQPTYSNAVLRTLPMFDIDSGLYFDRNVSLSNRSYQQTLEPRLFYLYVPYRNQNSIPIFDSGQIPFSYDSIFLTNRFSGYDRIGDANQIVFSLTTRLLDEMTGTEKFRLSVGDIAYFADRKVTLCSPLDNIVNSSIGATCMNPNSIVGVTSLTEKISPIAGQLYYALNKDWNTTANLAWDPSTKQTISGNLNLQYQPAANRVFNINYNYLLYGDVITVNSGVVTPNTQRGDLNQGGFSFGWPIGEQWAMVGGWNYNFGRAYAQSYFYGLQYDSCCWAVRLVAGKTFNSLNQNGDPLFNPGVYLQWQLKGLGTVSTADPSNLLLSNIPGYQDNFKALTSI